MTLESPLMGHAPQVLSCSAAESLEYLLSQAPYAAVVTSPSVPLVPEGELSEMEASSQPP